MENRYGLTLNQRFRLLDRHSQLLIICAFNILSVETPTTEQLQRTFEDVREASGDITAEVAQDCYEAMLEGKFSINEANNY